MYEAVSPRNIEPVAVLWDLDGTVIDSEEYWIVAETELVELFGGTWTHQDGLSVVGASIPHTAKAMQQHGVDLGVDEIVQSLTNRVLEQLGAAIPWRPGAVELLEQLHTAGIKQAMVTMSIGRMAHAVADSLPFSPFSAVIAGDQVTEPKPHPEPYLLAAETLGVDITKCVAFEDSPAGCTSAHTAGAFTIGVENILSLENVSKNHHLHTLAGFGYGDLLEILEMKGTRTS